MVVKIGEFHTARELSKNINEEREEKDYRKLLGLPATKKFVYYPSSLIDKCYFVDEYCVLEVFEDWFVLGVKVNNSLTTIHNAFFAEMQKPSFIRDMDNMRKLT